jgi:hypothetical protein
MAAIRLSQFFGGGLQIRTAALAQTLTVPPSTGRDRADWGGVETELVVYPREPHGFREEKHLIDRLNRIVTWYDRYMK